MEDEEEVVEEVDETSPGALKDVKLENEVESLDDLEEQELAEAVDDDDDDDGKLMSETLFW